MAKRVQILGHPLAEAQVFLGRDREVTVDTTTQTLRVHDGIVEGGTELAKANVANVPNATLSIPGRMSTAQVLQLNDATDGVAANAAAITTINTVDLPNKLNIVSGTVGHGVRVAAGGSQVETAGYAYERKFAIGTAMVFAQAAAPTGWAFDNTRNDVVLRITNDLGQANQLGGSWTISGLAVQGHALTANEMPSHNHAGSSASQAPHDHGAGNFFSEAGDGRTFIGTGVGQGYLNRANVAPAITLNIANAGASASHTHGLTADGAWRPSYLNVIICTKNE